LSEAHLEVVNVKVRIVGLDEGRAKYRLIVLGCDRLECIDARGAGALRVADHVGVRRDREGVASSSREYDRVSSRVAGAVAAIVGVGADQAPDL